MTNSPSLMFGLISVALSGVAQSANAQPAVDARLAVALDALRPSAFERETRGTIEGSLTPELTFASQRGRVYYEFEGGSFNTPGDWSFISHAIGASYRVDLKEAEKARLFAGGTGSWRRNGDAWSEANYDALAAFVNFELRPREGLTLWTGYRLADRSFDQLRELDQFEQDTFFSLNLNLRSRTTLIAESHFGWKSYQGETRYESVTPTAPSSPSSTSGRGRGGVGMGPSVRVTLPSSVSTGTTGENARQWNTMVRVAQGLGQRTGAWAQGFVRRISGDVPPGLLATPAGFFDDGVYDDPFASDMGALSLGAKHVFAGGAELQAQGSWQKKDFDAVVALDATGLALEGGALREDRITRGGLSLALPMPAPGAFSLGLALEYNFTRSRSNDAYYDYRSHAVGLALTVRR
ncbi:MAG: hypothetical protein KA385_17240 [Vicinamibacteria bacterium]|nr:hypothetical protein [Vicinamibacteria bacterium]